MNDHRRHRQVEQQIGKRLFCLRLYDTALYTRKPGQDQTVQYHNLFCRNDCQFHNPLPPFLRKIFRKRLPDRVDVLGVAEHMPSCGLRRPLPVPRRNRIHQLLVVGYNAVDRTAAEA